MNVLVVDDHPLVLEALNQLLKKLDRGAQVTEAQDAASFERALAAQPDLDLILLDLGLPGADGFDLLGRVRAERPEVPVVVVSASDDAARVTRAIDLGAMGFIPKNSSRDVMLSALRLVLSGGIYLPPTALSGRSSASSAPATPAAATAADAGLTARQAEVLGLLLQGMPNKVICRQLDLAEGTVKIHVAAILRTLGVATRTQLLVEASKRGWRVDDFR